jgi:hypothetical protein
LNARALVVPVLALLGCGAGSHGTESADSATGSAGLPPANAKADYQLGGAYTPPAGVEVVSRDRHASPAPGIYNICYVNGFQIQTEDETFWTSSHPDLILRDGSGNPIIDADWNEMLLDVSTAPKRTAIAAIIGDWIAGCATDGFSAIEIDNLDSFTRSEGHLDEAAAVAQMRLYADVAHARSLPIAQKNTVELVPRKTELGTDFAVAEECNVFAECDGYVAGYGNNVIVIERRAAFDTGCAAFPALSIVLRDVNLATPNQGAYVYDGC